MHECDKMFVDSVTDMPPIITVYRITHTVCIERSAPPGRQCTLACRMCRLLDEVCIHTAKARSPHIACSCGPAGLLHRV